MLFIVIKFSRKCRLGTRGQRG